MWEMLVCIATSRQKNIHEKLHTEHLGLVKMNGVARSLIWFPNIDTNITYLAKGRGGCAQTLASQKKAISTHGHIPRSHSREFI